MLEEKNLRIASSIVSLFNCFWQFYNYIWFSLCVCVVTVLVIGMGITGGFLILCITSLLVTTFCTIWYFKRKSKTKKHDECVHEQEEKEDTQTATSTPFYDVPVFTEYWEVDSATKSVCDHENNKGSEVSAAMPLYDVAVIKNYWDVNNTVLQNQVQPDELFVHQNTAYM